MRFLLPTIALTIFVAACDWTTEREAQPLVPLHVGNHWTFKNTFDPPNSIDGIGELESYVFSAEIIGDSTANDLHGFVRRTRYPEVLAPIAWGDDLIQDVFVANTDTGYWAGGRFYRNPSRMPVTYLQKRQSGWSDTTTVRNGDCPRRWKEYSCVVYHTRRSNGFTWRSQYVRGIGLVRSVRTSGSSNDKLITTLEEYDL